MWHFFHVFIDYFLRVFPFLFSNFSLFHSSFLTMTSFNYWNQFLGLLQKCLFSFRNHSLTVFIVICLPTICLLANYGVNWQSTTNKTIHTSINSIHFNSLLKAWTLKNKKLNISYVTDLNLEITENNLNPFWNVLSNMEPKINIEKYSFPNQQELVKDHLENIKSQTDKSTLKLAVILNLKSQTSFYTLWELPNLNQLKAKAETTHPSYLTDKNILVALELRLKTALAAYLKMRESGNDTPVIPDLDLTLKYFPTWIQQDESSSSSSSTTLDAVTILAPLWIMLGMFGFFFLTCTVINSEKSGNLLIPLKRMGLLTSIYFASHLFSLSGLACLATLLICGVHLIGHNIPKYLTYVAVGPYAIITFTCIVSMISLAFILSAIIKRPTTLRILMGLVLFAIISIIAVFMTPEMSSVYNMSINSIDSMTKNKSIIIHILLFFAPFLTIHQITSALMLHTQGYSAALQLDTVVYENFSWSQMSNTIPITDLESGATIFEIPSILTLLGRLWLGCLLHFFLAWYLQQVFKIGFYLFFR